MYVCLCKGVSDRVVRQCIREGARSLQQVGQECGAGTDCGACRGTIREMLEEGVESTRPASGHFSLPLLA